MLVLYQLLLKYTKCRYGELTVSLLFSAQENMKHAKTRRALVLGAGRNEQRNEGSLFVEGLARETKTRLHHLLLKLLSTECEDVTVCHPSYVKIVILSNSFLPVSLSAFLVVQEVKPTVFFGVPRVWEKFREKVEENLLEAKGWKEIVLEKSRVRPLAASTNH